MKIGDIVYGKITNIIGYGAFVTVEDYDGLIHISEFSDYFVRDISDYVKVGQEIKLKVIDVDEENKRVKLSYKQIHKSRGVKCRLPVFKIGFKPLKDNLPLWIAKEKEKGHV
ncbi:MAG TPA: S1 RNA-binding domain-containing protein [Bacilli bacterium]|jgi:general stress protein 13|nr:S1 RNA-binding domain-containing protein [Acholeplasmataceae bacterium]OQB64240.1 MAG: General stress protein 13 [Tenericutes bacterium ADurb.Bin140]HOE77260.1 S1 RNA-binding domain-containing protein [Bacilli bacterium]HON63574.1 S1 RNA-binding domain-containing protein [Bacilli bacterium]HOR95682.1 S1 RNA-binding domain-containing protein [Bacilli bacterium]